jgi:hypothetical protein
MLSSSNVTAIGLTEELVPKSLDRFTVCLDQSDDLVQDARVEAIIISNRNVGAKPQLRLEFSAFDVNVGWFSRIALVRKEKEPEAASAEYRGH